MKKTVYTGIVIGIILFVASAFQQYGIMITKSAGKSGFITGLYIVIIPLIEWIVFGRRTNIYIWTSVFLAISGLYLLSIFDNKSFGLGDILLLICAVFFSLHVIAIDRNLDGIYPLKLAFVQFLVCGLLNMTCALIFEDISYDGLMSVKIPILYGSFGSVGIAYTCQILGQRGSSPTASALIMSMESVFSVIGGVIILGEKLSTVSLVGCALIFLGIIVSQINPSEKKI